MTNSMLTTSLQNNSNHLIFENNKEVPEFPAPLYFFKRWLDFVRKLLNQLQIGEELPGKYANYSIGRNCNQHSNNSANTSCYQNNYEYFERMCLYAVRINIGLEKEDIYHMSNEENKGKVS